MNCEGNELSGVFPAGSCGLFGPFLSLRWRHCLKAFLPADLSALPAHLGHDTGKGLAVNWRLFGGFFCGRGYDGCGYLVWVFQLAANSLWHGPMMHNGDAYCKRV